MWNFRLLLSERRPRRSESQPINASTRDCALDENCQYRAAALIAGNSSRGFRLSPAAARPDAADHQSDRPLELRKTGTGRSLTAKSRPLGLGASRIEKAFLAAPRRGEVVVSILFNQLLDQRLPSLSRRSASRLDSDSVDTSSRSGLGKPDKRR